MTFAVEVLLKGRDDVVEEVVHREGTGPSMWTDDDVRDVLRLILLSFDRVLNSEAENRTVSLRGLSWIVTPVETGVIIAIEIPSGAVVAGPFDAQVESLTKSLGRALANPEGTPEAVSDTIH
jgi:hypothetical protein